MAGYLITLNSKQSLENYIKSGTYSTILRSPRYHTWGVNHEGTFADYLSMKENDYIFFFVDRKIYGCGRLVNVSGECKYLNYKNADSPYGSDSDENYKEHLLQYGSTENRCFCTFKPYPFFFKKGVDMDEVLQNTSCPFRSVRTLWKLSFIKMDDDESESLFGIILKHNENYINMTAEHFQYESTYHELLATQNLKDYKLSYSTIINSCRSAGGIVKHEMAIEATLCDKLIRSNVEPFGKWDYVSHQVAASPFKPVDYMDKMDIWGYKYIPGYKVKSKFLIAELKKDACETDAVEQILKYVDWVADEYANGDYSMIEAYIVASNFNNEVIENVKNHCIRNFSKGFRPTQFCTWNFVKLVKYEATENDITFKEIDLN